MTESLVSNYSFESIEQLGEVMQDMGWLSEYRQLKPGSFSSTCTVQEDESGFLAEEQSSRRMEIEFKAPENMVVLGLVKGEPVVANGQCLSADHIYIQGSNPEVRATFPAGVRVTQIGVMADQFEAILQAVVPEWPAPFGGVHAVATTPGCLVNLRRAARHALFAPARRKASRDEAVANILAGMVAVAAAHGKKAPGRSLHRASAVQNLKRAREYIEDNLDRVIRIADLCQYAGTNLKTLQRTFLREMGVTPQQYVKARRLNAVRNRLLAADRNQDPSVTGVALSFGFTHLGRFAGEYYRHFGEYPKETLRRQ